ncbi:MAG: response regulator transcription factor [Burkholderiales bacterium]|jgi:DNA-binding response OmpR family regulator|nr:response regulator transcription factor [Burkholderiales bacterium]
MRILVLEDDAAQGDALTSLLEQSGHKAHLFTRGDDVMRVLRREIFDLALLDWHTPGATGREVLTWIREQLLEPLPVIFVSQQDNETAIVDALTAGADDYLTKPIRPAELLARIAAVMRRRANVDLSQQPMLRVGTLTLDRSARSATVRGRLIDLTQKEFELAWYLFRHLGQLVPRVQTLQAIWGVTESVNSRTLDTHISRLRRKLELTPENGFCLISVYGYGYRVELIEPESVATYD